MLKIVKLMIELGLKIETNIKFNNKLWVDLMLKDKKSYDNYIGLILIKEIGKPYITKKSPFYYVEKKKMLNFLDSYE